jgi:hypothetical protein
MVWHDDIRVQEKLSLIAIVENGSFQKFRRRRDLKKASALRRHSGDHVSSSFLRREVHCSNIPKARG